LPGVQIIYKRSFRKSPIGIWGCFLIKRVSICLFYPGSTDLPAMIFLPVKYFVLPKIKKTKNFLRI